MPELSPALGGPTAPALCGRCNGRGYGPFGMSEMPVVCVACHTTGYVPSQPAEADHGVRP